jgi:hypothetical protein
MNKLTKVGVSALCGSLAALSAANAGEMTVSGSVDMSWTQMDQVNDGNQLGMGSNVSFAGTTELENGWSVKFAVDAKNTLAYSSANVTVTVPGLGDVLISQGLSGTGIHRMDDITPTAWEEAYGAGLASGVNRVYGGAAGAGIELTPTDLMPSGIVTRLHWTPDAGGSNAGDKATGANDGPTGNGYDITVTASGDATPDGLKIYGGFSNIEQAQDHADINDDVMEWTAGVEYAVGGFTLGYQYSEEDNGRATTTTGYDNTGYGIVFAINDDLSIGYNNYESKQLGSGSSGTLEASSYQIAYSSGGLSIRLAEQDIDNKNYATAAANQREGTTLSVALAF